MQAVVFFAGGSLAFHWTVLISAPIVVGFAALSWNFVEKPALSLRTTLGRLEGWWMETRLFKAATSVEDKIVAAIENRQLKGSRAAG
jgi:peptidoglycan/LPS O-acetylase OafA/YrhL